MCPIRDGNATVGERETPDAYESVGRGRATNSVWTTL